MSPFPRWRVFFWLLAAPALAAAQTNLVSNGNFLRSTATDNLWDGVNARGGLAGEARSAYAVTAQGPPGSITLPVSVSFVDMNGDGVPDIVSADPAGTMRVYFNSGTRTEPKFTHAEVVPLFLSRPAKDEAWDSAGGHGMAKIAMYDWNRSGSNDLLFGNYAGEIVFIPNAGSATSPSFPQPPQYQRATVPTSARGHLWGNLFAPCVYDWNKDGKPDLLIGEGSYSANSIHLLLNERASTGGKFSDASHYFLCFGDGREHLVPTLADWDGDGEMDVLVGDRTGSVAVHLRQPNWKPGDEVKFTRLVSFGGQEKLGVAIAPYACDFNGDGLFDLLFGRADGKIQVAINKGMKGQPKFEMPVDVAGQDIWGQNILHPAGWSTDNGNNRGNIYGYVTVTDEPSPGEGRVMKMGYWPSPNKIIKLVHPTAAGGDTARFFANGVGRWYPLDAGAASTDKHANAFSFRQILAGLKTGQNYVLSFKVRGKRMSESVATVALFGVKELEKPKFAKKPSGRGATMTRNEKTEEIRITQDLQNSNSWQSISKPFTVAFKEKETKTLTEPTFAILEFKATLAPYDGECSICDVTVTPAK